MPKGGRRTGSEAALGVLSLCRFSQISLLFFFLFLPLAGSYTEGAQRLQEQRDGGARVESPFNQVTCFKSDEGGEKRLHDLVSERCSLQLALFMHAWGVGCTMQRARAELMKYDAMFKTKLFMFIPQVSQTIVDHHSLSRAVPPWHSPPLRTLSAGR